MIISAATMSARLLLKLLFLPVACVMLTLSATTATASSPANTLHLTLPAAPAPSPDSSCAAEKTSKSINSNTVSSFTVTNNTSITLSLFWLNFQGTRVLYQTIPSGATISQSTFQTHPWVIADPTGSCLHLFTVTTTLDIRFGQAPATPQASLPDARLEGNWHLSAAVSAVEPLPQGVTFPAGAVPSVGTKGTANVNIVPTCVSPQACSVNVLSVDSNTLPSIQGGFVSPGTGAFGLLAHAAGTNTYVYQPTGFGSGPCVGSFTHYFSAGLTLNVTKAQKQGNAVLATQVSGSERVLGASCINGATQPFFYFLAINEGTPAPQASSGTSPISAPSIPLPNWITHLSSTNSAPPISSALSGPAQAFSSPTRTIINLVIAGAVVLFITFPSQLFNHTLEENYAEIRRRLVRFLHLPKRLETPAPSSIAPKPGVRAPIFWSMVASGAFLGALLNPKFGFNIPTYLGLVGSAITILWGLWLSYAVSRSYRQASHTASPAYFKALPAGLLVAGLCVLVSRLTDFTPGYLYGVVYSVGFTSKLAKRQDGQLTALSTIAGLGVAVLAWLAWSPLHTISATGLQALGLLVVTSALASVFIGGLISSLINMAPIRYLSGHKLINWRREVWALIFGLSVFLVLEVLLFPAQSAKNAHASTTPLLVTLGLFLAFGIFSVAFWWYFARRKTEAKEKAGQGTASGEAPGQPAPFESPLEAAIPIVAEPAATIPSVIALPQTEPFDRQDGRTR